MKNEIMQAYEKALSSMEKLRCLIREKATNSISLEIKVKGFKISGMIQNQRLELRKKYFDLEDIEKGGTNEN